MGPKGRTRAGEVVVVVVVGRGVWRLVVEMLDTDSQCQLQQLWSPRLSLKGTAKDKNTDLIPNTSAVPRLNIS